MNFLEAHRVLSSFEGGPALPLRLLASGNIDQLVLYVRAVAATRGRAADVSTIPFGTLGQALLAPAETGTAEVLLLMPWDFVPESDWRSGIPRTLPSPNELLAAAHEVADQISKRGGRVVFVPAPIPPLYPDPASSHALADGITGIAASLGARSVSRQCFGLGNYLSTGMPIAGVHIGEVVDAIIESCLGSPDGAFKVLVTDLDNVVWAGLAAEDGPDGVQCSAEGVGYRHFLYQGLLRQLKSTGILLAAVSRNDVQLARAPIVAGKTLLAESDFVEILASFEPKSVHVRRLASSLNLGLDSFVFVDDNPIELAEVGTAIQEIRCVEFPSNDDAIPEFLTSLRRLFARRTLTAEDRQRTEMYRNRRSIDVADIAIEGGDIRAFLADLRMELTIHDRGTGDRERAVQLINKTNQFNLNGRRVSDEEVGAILASGGTLYTANLDDRTGSHGEILACLIDRAGRIQSLVLSCRVFQRRVEHAFLAWLLRQEDTASRDLILAFAPTERNTPLREFLAHSAFIDEGGEKRVDGPRFLADHASDLELFNLKEPVA